MGNKDEIIFKRRGKTYAVPVSQSELYKDQFIARFEAEPIREAGEFVIKNWWWEPGRESNDKIL